MERLWVFLLLLVPSTGLWASTEDSLMTSLQVPDSVAVESPTSGSAVADSIVVDSTVADSTALQDSIRQKVCKVPKFFRPVHNFLTQKSSLTPPPEAYKPLDDISWVGAPIFLAGILLKGEKEAFRQDYNNPHTQARLVSSFKTGVDDYLQYFSPALTVGLKIGGVEGRSDWLRLITSAAMTYGIEALLVNGIKYTSREQRPDGTSRNSWPSGHTATAFAGATILHKEYGLTRSPWYSVAGYGVATATGVLRVLNNRHWVSDVFSGAGIGIMAGEVGYMLSDLIFKDRHLLRNDLSSFQDMRTNPSFYSVSMGVGFGSHELDFSQATSLPDHANDIKLKFRMATVVGAEGAYFFHRNVGVGGRLRVSTMPIKGWSDFVSVGHEESRRQLTELLGKDKSTTLDINASLQDLMTTKEYGVVSDHLAEFAFDGGMYFHFPLSRRFAIGTKALIGGSVMQALDISAHYLGNQKGLDYDLNEQNGSSLSMRLNGLTTKLDGEGNPLAYDTEWDYFTLKGSRSVKYGTGISLTYAYKHNFSLRAFVDYDYTRKTFTLTYDANHYLRDALPEIYGLATSMNYDLGPVVYTQHCNMHRWVLGGALCISF